MNDTLLSRVEDAGLNASAPPQQRWMDGWLLRFSPGKARRARCVNAVARGRLSLHEKLELAAGVYADAGLPMAVRITRFTEPPELDAELAARGWQMQDDTRVMVATPLTTALTAPVLVHRSPCRPVAPPGLAMQRLPATAYAAAVGALRGSPQKQIDAHAQRLSLSPVPYLGFAFCAEDGSVQACGQVAREGTLAGLYDVYTRPSARGQGLAQLLCERMLSMAASTGATAAYLQVDGDNATARRIYQRLGFVDGYGYHYRVPPEAG